MLEGNNSHEIKDKVINTAQAINNETVSSPDYLLLIIQNNYFIFLIITALIILFISVLLFIYNKEVKNFMLNNKYLNKSNDNNNTIEQAQINYGKEIENETVEELNIVDRASEIDIKRDNPSMTDMYVKIEEGDFEAADKLFQEWSKQNSNDIENKCLYYHLLFTHGQTNALDSLNSISENENKFIGLLWIGRSYKAIGEDELALINFENAKKEQVKKSDYLKAELNIYTIKYKSNKYKFSIKDFRKLLHQYDEQEDIKKICEVIADILFEEKEYFEATFYYNIYLSIIPNDARIIFRIAYCYSYFAPELSIMYYKKHIDISKNNSASYNNLAILMGDFELKNKQVNNYKNGIEQGDEYSAANMASIYIDNGLFIDAEDILKPHLENAEYTKITSEYSRVKDLIKKEDESENKILKNANLEKAFFQKYTLAIRKKEKIAATYFNSEWTYDSSIIQLNIGTTKWIENDTEYKLELFDFDGIGFKVKYTINKKQSGLLGFGGTSLHEGYGYIIDDNNIEIILFMNKKYNSIKTIVRVTQTH